MNSSTSTQRKSATSADGVPPYVVALGFGAAAVLGYAAVVFLLVFAGWALDPRTSTPISDALGVTGAMVALTVRGSVSVSHNGVDGLHAAPILLTVLLGVLARWCYRPVQRRLDADRLSPALQQRAAVTFVVGFLLGALGIALLSYAGPAHVVLWTLPPGALLVVLVATLWALVRDGDIGRLPWSRALSERLHPHVGRAWRPAAEGIGLLSGVGVLVLVTAVVLHLDRISALGDLLDVRGGGVVLLWLGQLLFVPNMVAWAVAWASGGGVGLGAGMLGLTEVSPARLPVAPMLGVVPEPGPLPGWTSAVVVLPVLVGAFVGWRVSARMARLSTLNDRLQVTGTALGVLVLGHLVATWFARAGMTPGELHLLGPTMLSVLLLAVELVAGALAATCITHWFRARR